MPLGFSPPLVDCSRPVTRGTDPEGPPDFDFNGSVGVSDLLAEGGINQFVNSQQPFARATPWILAMPVGRADIGMLYLVRSVASVGGAVPADERSSTLLR